MSIKKKHRDRCFFFAYLTLAPCGTAEEHQHGQNFQTAHDHAQGEHELGQVGQRGEISAGAYQIQSGADVAHTGQSGAGAGAGGEGDL